MQDHIRSIALIVVLGLLSAACGGETSAATVATTQAPSSTTAADGDALAIWAAGLAPGTCFDDVWTDDGAFDFSTPAAVTDCADEHDNVVVSIDQLPGDPGAGYPDDIEVMAQDSCAAAWMAFAGADYENSTLERFWVYPDEEDWAAGNRQSICAAYSSGPMVGGVSSAGLTAPGEMLVYLGEVDDVDLWTMSGDGTGATNLTNDAAIELRGRAAWSPDGTRIAYAVEVDGNADIYVIGADGSGKTRLTTDPGVDDTPVWSPDGTRIAFISDRANGEFDIYTMAADGSDVQRITSNPDRDSSPDWHPDGSLIVYRGRVGGNSNIYITNVTGGITYNLTTDPAFDGDPTWSPDGEQVLFTTDRTGDYEIFVMDADGSNQRNLTNHPADDEFPSWSSDGAFVAFQSDRQWGLYVYLMRADGSEQSVLTDTAPSGYPRFRP